jgi:drug/metabolite transporter (DMT)-like permease
MLIWGVSWTAGKIVSDYTTSDVLLFWRNAITAIAILPGLYFLRLKPVFKRETSREAIVGAILTVLYGFLFLQGLRTGLAGAGGVLVTCLNPLVNFALVAILGTHKLTKREALGLLLGFFGGMVILAIWTFDIKEVFREGNIYFLLASVVWAFNSINAHHAGKSMNPIVYSFYLHLFSTVITFFFGYSSGLLQVLNFDLKFWIALFYLSAISTGFATTIYFIASSRLGSQKASSFIFLVPGSALIGSFFLLGEIPKWNTIIGGVIAIFAVRIINTRKIIGQTTP